MVFNPQSALFTTESSQDCEVDSNSYKKSQNIVIKI